MKLGILFSGGKDSFLAMLKAMENHHEIACLITIISKNNESYMFHVPAIELACYHAKALDIPLVEGRTQGIKEKELTDLKIAIKEAMIKYQINGIVTGAIASTYQTSRIQRICDELGLWCFNPLWEMDQMLVLREIINAKLKTIITGIAAYPLDEKWLGREIDDKFYEDVLLLEKKYMINPAGEGGEFETLVTGSPIHKYTIKILEAEKHYCPAENWGILMIKKVELENTHINQSV